MNAKGAAVLQNVKNVVGQHIRMREKQKLMASGGASASWYDAEYRGPAVNVHTAHYSQSRHLTVWESICERIPMGSRILEVGCGPAQFAHLLMDRKIPGGYVGFDFSPAAIEIASKKLPGSRVELADARTTDLFTSVDYDIVVCTEVLGHLVDDLTVLGRIPREKQILATVPDFEGATHVRFFQNTAEVLDRYRCLFSSLEISELHAAPANGSGNTYFLLDGVR
jgi:trans-aconitate methyltransferase